MTTLARPVAHERRGLAYDAWPSADRAAWCSAQRPGDPFDDAPGPASRWRPATVRHVRISYGQWLGFLAAAGRLDGSNSPAGRLTPEAVGAYIAALRPACHDATVLMRVQGLLEAARVMFPDNDWAWLRRTVARLKANVTSRKPKLSRMRPSTELFRLGLDLMDEAEVMLARRPLRGAARFRDGLIIAFLAARPLRASSFCALRLGHSIVRIGDSWHLQLAESETKAAIAYEAPLPPDLVPALERYLVRHRPRLLRGRDDDHLWITQEGAPMRPHALRTRVVRLTAARLGVAITPHLFRDCAATTIAVADPKHVRIAAAVLGHRSLTTTEQHYNQARSLEATRAYCASRRRLRRQTATAVGRRRQEKRPCAP